MRPEHKTGPACDETGPIFPGSEGRIRTYDLWVMRLSPVVSRDTLSLVSAVQVSTTDDTQRLAYYAPFRAIS
jgi:hypothetical protein